MQTLRHAWLQLNATLWFVPLLCGIAGVALALWMLTAPPTPGAGPLETLVYGGDARSARDLLGALLGGMITMTALVVSITVVVLTLAAAQLGPRLIRSFTEDRVTQWVLGLFVGTILYLLIVLRTIEGDHDDAAPAIAVTVGTLLSAGCLIALLFHIDRLAQSIVSDTIVHRVAEDLIARHARAPAPGGTGARAAAAPTPSVAFDAADAAPVFAPADGYLRSVDLERIVGAACDADVIVRLRHRPGDWIVAGTALAEAAPARRVDEAFVRRIAATVVVGPSRTPDQDVGFAMRRLSEIAVRALSPGVNDPYTAIAAIDHLRSALARLLAMPPAPAVHCDAHGAPRLLGDPSEAADLVAAAFDAIRRAGAGSPEVAVRLLETFAQLVPFARDDGQRNALRAQADATLEVARRAGWAARDTVIAERRYHDVLARLSTAG